MASKSILLIDDSPAIHKVVKIAFSRLKVDLSSALSVAEGDVAVKKTRFDVVLVDCGMTDDVATWKRVVGVCGSIPVIGLTSELDKIRESEFVQLGIKHFVRKPFESKDLVAKVSELLRFDSPAPSEPAPSAPVTDEKEEMRSALPPLPAQGASIAETQLPPIPTAPARPEIPPATVGFQKGFSSAKLGEEDTAPDAQVHAIALQALQDVALKGSKAFGDSRPPSSRSEFESTPARPSSPAPERPSRADDLPFAVSPPTRSGEQPSFMQPKPAGTTDFQLTPQVVELIKSTIEDYCARHFPEIAREVILNEVRRLADEKSRLLMDNY